ncbi:MAG: LPP20 family lipoprotein [Elusimicrobia bacterium]|nr:LPP20 family lipoprotein [Elusimicrobiota bacterium]
MGGYVGLLGYALALGLVAGCATTSKPQQPVGPASPEWVMKGSGAFKDANGISIIYGVGASQGTRLVPLARNEADNKAAEEISRVINNYVSGLLKSYMASTTAGDLSKSSEEKHVSSTMKAYTQSLLHGAQVIDHWKDPQDGTLYALAKLDMTGIRKALEETKELDAKVRDYVRANAEKAFDELAAEEAKH